MLLNNARTMRRCFSLMDLALLMGLPRFPSALIPSAVVVWMRLLSVRAGRLREPLEGVVGHTGKTECLVVGVGNSAYRHI
jgi:hypothetical protein